MGGLAALQKYTALRLGNSSLTYKQGSARLIDGQVHQLTPMLYGKINPKGIGNINEAIPKRRISSHLSNDTLRILYCCFNICIYTYVKLSAPLR